MQIVTIVETKISCTCSNFQIRSWQQRLLNQISQFFFRSDTVFTLTRFEKKTISMFQKAKSFKKSFQYYTHLKINLSAILENVDNAAVQGSVCMSLTNFQTASVFFLSKRLSWESDLSKASIRASVSKYKFSSVIDCLTQ